MKKKLYISYDYDHDLELKNNFIEQSKNPKLNFIVKDESIQHSLESKWKKFAKKKIRNCDLMVILCGMNTHNAVGVNAEVTIAQDVNTPYILIDGRKGKGVKPKGVRKNDTVHRWKWNAIIDLINKESKK